MGFVLCPRTFRPSVWLETSFVRVANPLDGVCSAYCLLYCFPFIVADPVYESCVAYAFPGVSKSLLHEREQMLMQRAVYANLLLTNVR